jgi:hypothetical protein
LKKLTFNKIVFSFHSFGIGYAEREREREKDRELYGLIL